MNSSLISHLQTYDRRMQDDVLAADLVVNVLDVRKLMTLGEREHLRGWF